MAKKNKVRSTGRKKKTSSKTASSVGSLDLGQWFARDAGMSSRETRLLAYIMLGVFVIMALLSTRVGLNGDDDVQANYASDLPAFYTSLGTDTTCFTSGPEIKYYGALFELATGATNQILGIDKTAPAYYKVRHVWNALFGAVAIYFMALFVGRIAGFRASLLSLTLIFLTMRFLGHSLFNPKDIPFATGYMVGLYYLYRTLSEMPTPSRSTLIGMTAGIAISIGVRVGGVLMIAYAGLFLGLHFLISYGLGKIFSDWQKLKPYVMALLIPSVAGLALSLLVWPYGLLDPFEHVPQAFRAFSDFRTAIKVLFNGEMVWSMDIPFQYIITWMAITWPVFSLVGLILFFVFLRGLFGTYNPAALLFSGFAFLFPIAYVIVSGSVLYDGWRHFLFVYPPAMILITLAWWYAYQRFAARPRWQYGVIALLVLSSVDSLVFLARNSAYPYVYFNPVSGGIKGAYGYYELDYWGASVKQAVEWMEEQGIIGENMTDTIEIATNFSHAAQVYTHAFGDNVKINYVRWRDRYKNPWDYGIFVNRFVDGTYIRAGYWPTSKTVYSVKANNTILAIIEKEHPEQWAFQGNEAINLKNWDLAIEQLSREVAAHPDNEIAWVGLGMSYLNKGQNAEARAPLEKALEITPENQNGLNFMGYYHFANQSYGEASHYFSKAAELHQTNALAVFYLGRIQVLQKNYTGAIEYVDQCIEANPNFAECYQLAAEAYQAMGDNANAQRYMAVYNQLTGRN